MGWCTLAVSDEDAARGVSEHLAQTMKSVSSSIPHQLLGLLRVMALSLETWEGCRPLCSRILCHKSHQPAQSTICSGAEDRRGMLDVSMSPKAGDPQRP